MSSKPNITIQQHQWPPRSGCADTEEVITLYQGTFIDRFGSNKGNYFGIPGEPYVNRSLPWFGSGEYKINNTINNCSNPINREIKNKYNSFYSDPDTSTNPEYDYHMYKVNKPFYALKCTIAPAFGFPGGGTQYKTNQNIQFLIDNGFIEEVPYINIPSFDECNYGGKKHKINKNNIYKYKTNKNKKNTTNKKSKKLLKKIKIKNKINKNKINKNTISKNTINNKTKSRR